MRQQYTTSMNQVLRENKDKLDKNNSRQQEDYDNMIEELKEVLKEGFKETDRVKMEKKSIVFDKEIEEEVKEYTYKVAKGIYDRRIMEIADKYIDWLLETGRAHLPGEDCDPDEDSEEVKEWKKKMLG